MQTIRAVQPDVVVVELCQYRVSMLKMDERTLLREAKEISLEKLQQAVRQVRGGRPCGHSAPPGQPAADPRAPRHAPCSAACEPEAPGHGTQGRPGLPVSAEVSSPPWPGLLRTLRSGWGGERLSFTGFQTEEEGMADSRAQVC